MVPQPTDIPEELRDLRPAQIYALRPVELHQGDLVRDHEHGYRRFTAPSCLSWARTSVRTKIDQLPPGLQGRARTAFRWLLRNNAAYLSFAGRHEAWIRAGAVEATRRWRFVDIATPAVECALWPHLYPTEAFADSRDSDESQQEQHMEDGDDSDEVDMTSHFSTKASFAAKLRSPVLDYAAWYDLAAFVYDRWLFKSVTGAATVASWHGGELHRAVAHRAFAAGHYDRLWQVMNDVHLQLGPANLFITLSPLEYTFPYSAVLQNTLTKVCRHRLGLAAVEVDHIMNVLQQTLRGLVAGTSDVRWRRHLLSNKVTGARNVRAMVVRTEFQPGRKASGAAPSNRNAAPAHRVQAVHARHAGHLHCCIWLDSLEQTLLDHVARCDLAVEDLELSLLAAQVQRSHAPCAPVREERTSRVYEGTTLRTWRWHYPQSASDQGIRMYLPTLLRVLRGHMDVQQVASHSDVNMYMSKINRYVSKESTLFQHLLRSASSWVAARSMLQWHRPAEAEVYTDLLRHRRDWFLGRRKYVTPPLPSTARDHQLYALYLDCEERPEDMPFLDWLRAFRTSTRPPQPYRVRSLTAIGVNYCSFWKPDFWGQWLCMRCSAHRHVQDLLHPDALKVPEHLKWFVHAWRKAPDIWDTDEGCRREFVVLGAVKQNLENLILHTHAMRVTAGMFLRGDMYNQQSAPVPVPPINLIPEQATIFQYILQEAQRREDESFDGSAAMACAVTGEAGSGKSALISALAQHFRSEGVAIFTFAAAFGVTLRSFCPGAHVDTVHGGFRVGEAVEVAAPALLKYRLIMIDEFVMLPRELFDHIMSCWHFIGCLPVLLLAGDWLQLQPFDEAGREVAGVIQSVWWPQVSVRTLRAQHRTVVGPFDTLCRDLRLRHITHAELCWLSEGRVFSEGPMSASVAEALLRQHPSTQVLGISRRFVRDFNAMAVQGLFGQERPLVWCTLMDEAEAQPLYVGMRVMLQRNQNKPLGEVNGLVGELLDSSAGILYVRAQGQVVPVHRWHDEATGRAAYPLHVAYATTLAKAQGRTLPHVTVQTDVIDVRGAGYVAMTRVRQHAHLLFLTPPRRRFWRPAM